MSIKLRDYQEEAVNVALRMKRVTIVMPTGTGKTIIAAEWLRRINPRKAMVIEPTRILVEQTSYVLNKFGLGASALHGGKSKEEKERAKNARIVVTTPEEALNYPEVIKYAEAVVVDECHHVIGKDSYVKVMERVNAEWRLGLSAFIPSDRIHLVEKYIGPIVKWDWRDPRIRKYLPKCITEVYEAELVDACRELYEKLKIMWSNSAGHLRAIYALALRYLSRDGPLALWETFKKGTLLGKLIDEEELLERCVKKQPLHKIDALRRILKDHEFNKAIIFVERVIIAKEIGKEFDAALILGKRSGGAELEEARRRRIIVSTSAGEEGLDLPEADLLIIWSNTASTLRLIQRLGRLLRPSEKLKYLVFIATPDTVDMDLLVEGIELAKKVGFDVPIEPDLLKRILRRSSVGSVLDALRGRPLYEEFVAEIAALPLPRVRRILRKLGAEGIAAYIYGAGGKLWFLQEDAALVWSEGGEYLEPCEKVKVEIEGIGKFDSVEKASEELMNVAKVRTVANVTIHCRCFSEGIEAYDFRKYLFKITNPEVAKIIVYNACSRGLLGF